MTYEGLIERLKAAQKKHLEAIEEIGEIEKALKIQALELRRCESPPCSTEFVARRTNQRFCSASCRSNARHYR